MKVTGAIKFDGAITRETMDAMIIKVHTLRGIQSNDATALRGDLTFLANMLGMSDMCVLSWMKKCDTNPVHARSSIRKISSFLEQPLSEIHACVVPTKVSAFRKLRIERMRHRNSKTKNKVGRKPMNEAQRERSATSRGIKKLCTYKYLGDPLLWHNLPTELLGQVLAGISGVKAVLKKEARRCEEQMKSFKAKLAVLEA